MTPRLGIITASVRQGRVGDKVAAWIEEQARAHGGFEIDTIDLAEVALPITTDEPNHPAKADYVQDRTKAWSRRVAACNAFVIVTPEYNHGYPAALKNALDLVYREWAYKPVGFASYGGISGGLRSVQQLKLVALMLRMVPVLEAFVATFVANQIEDGVFKPAEPQVEGTMAMLDEIAKLADVLMPLQHRFDE